MRSSFTRAIAFGSLPGNLSRPFRECAARGYAMPFTESLSSLERSGGVFAKSMADVSYLRLLRPTVFALQLVDVSIRMQSPIFKAQTLVFCQNRNFPY